MFMYIITFFHKYPRYISKYSNTTHISFWKKVNFTTGIEVY